MPIAPPTLAIALLLTFGLSGQSSVQVERVTNGTFVSPGRPSSVLEVTTGNLVGLLSSVARSTSDRPWSARQALLLEPGSYVLQAQTKYTPRTGLAGARFASVEVVGAVLFQGGNGVHRVQTDQPEGAVLISGCRLGASLLVPVTTVVEVRFESDNIDVEFDEISLKRTVSIALFARGAATTPSISVVADRYSAAFQSMALAVSIGLQPMPVAIPWIDGHLQLRHPLIYTTLGLTGRTESEVSFVPDPALFGVPFHVQGIALRGYGITGNPAFTNVTTLTFR